VSEIQNSSQMKAYDLIIFPFNLRNVKSEWIHVFISLPDSTGRWN